MATGKVERKTPPRAPQAAALARLSMQMYSKTLDVMIEWIKAGRSNLMQGYASSMVMTDFLHSAGMITDGAFNSVNILSSIMDASVIGEGIFSTIFGNGALGPTLRTAVEQDVEGGDEAGAAAQAASLSSLTPAILAALA